jgi:hypothetical protein
MDGFDMDQQRPDDAKQQTRRPTGGIALAAGISVLLMLVVLAASAWIRVAGAEEELRVVRAVHRIAASTVALLVTALAVLAWRRRRLVGAAAGAFLFMLALSVVGWVAGTAPPPPAAFFNQAGGLVLTGLLAWIRAGASSGGTAEDALGATALTLAVAQGAFGAAIAAFSAGDPPVLVLILHAACGLAASALVAACGGALALAGALSAPVAGIAAALALAPPFAPVAHALSAGLLVAAAGMARRRAS